MRSIIAIVVIVFLTALTGGFVSAKDTVMLDNGLLVDGRAMVPLRSIFQTIGADVNWNSAEQTVIATRGGTSEAVTTRKSQVSKYLLLIKSLLEYLSFTPLIISSSNVSSYRIYQENLSI